MQNLYFTTPFIIFCCVISITLGSIFTFIRDRYYRNIKDSIIDGIKLNRIQAVQINGVKSKKTYIGLGASILWEHADIVFTDQKVFYFGFMKIFGHIPAYTRVERFYLGGEKSIHPLSKSIPIKSISISGSDLIIISTKNLAKITTTLKDVAQTGQFKTIQQMLNLPLIKKKILH